MKNKRKPREKHENHMKIHQSDGFFSPKMSFFQVSKACRAAV